MVANKEKTVEVGMFQLTLKWPQSWRWNDILRQWHVLHQQSHVANTSVAQLHQHTFVHCTVNYMYIYRMSLCLGVYMVTQKVRLLCFTVHI